MRNYLKDDISTWIFAETLLKIGNGNCPILECEITSNPSSFGKVVSPLSELTSKIHPVIINIKKKPTEWLCKRVILTPKNKMVAGINETILKSVKYRPFDSVIQPDDAVHFSIEFPYTKYFYL